MELCTEDNVISMYGKSQWGHIVESKQNLEVFSFWSINFYYPRHSLDRLHFKGIKCIIYRFSKS